MAWTYATLSAALQDYLQTDEATFVADIPIIIQQAEDRILKQVQLPDFRKNATSTTTTDDEYLCIPTDFLAPYSLAVDNSGYEFLLFKEVSFIREVQPDRTASDTPKYYAIFQDDNFILAPTPDADYSVELHYFYRPESIVTAGTSWLGTHAESTLLYGCLLEGYTFQKGDPDLMAKYTERYNDALAALRLLGEGRNKTDSYRIG